jgi:hypothetical protein
MLERWRLTFRGSSWVAPTEDTGVSVAEFLFGAPLVLPGQILATDEPPPADFVAKLRQSSPPPPSRPISDAQMAAEQPAAYVYIRKGGTIIPLSPLYSGLYKVLSRTKDFKAGDREEVVSIDSLKLHRRAVSVQPVQPPARGRPSLADSFSHPRPRASSWWGVL